MAVTVPTTAEFAVGGFLLSGNATQAEFGITYAMKDKTTLGSGGFREFTTSLKTVTGLVVGFNDYAASEWDEYARTIWGTQRVMTACPVDGAVGSLAQISQGVMQNTQPFNASAPGELPGINVEFGGAGTVAAEGLITQASTSTITATGHTTAVNVGAVSATQAIYAAIHVLSVTGTTPSATFQLETAATSGGAYTLRGSAGSALSAQGDQWLSAAGAITDTWAKLAVTVSGTSPVFTVLAAIAVI